ncbi:MAG: zf-TFIIB domain-containing protein [Pseudomonadota bacterium]
MKCPICNVDLQLSERQTVEIDYCPKCRGVWLDRGELDKLIELSPGEMRQSEPAPQYREQQGRHYDDHHDEQRYHKKRSFLQDLFD